MWQVLTATNTLRFYTFPIVAFIHSLLHRKTKQLASISQPWQKRLHLIFIAIPHSLFRRMTKKLAFISQPWTKQISSISRSIPAFIITLNKKQPAFISSHFFIHDKTDFVYFLTMTKQQAPISQHNLRVTTCNLRVSKINIVYVISQLIQLSHIIIQTYLQFWKELMN